MQLNLVGVAEVQATCCIYALRQIRPRLQYFCLLWSWLM